MYDNLEIIIIPLDCLIYSVAALSLPKYLWLTYNLVIRGLFLYFFRRSNGFLLKFVDLKYNIFVTKRC